MPFNIPNLLTWLRILLIPLFVGIFYFEKSWVSLPNQNLVATVIFTLAAVTDWFDGWLARKLNQTSAFGAFLDPVADKLMVAVTLFLIVQENPTPLMAVTSAVIVGREITISALREWMAEMGARGKVAVSSVGKLKTIFQMTGLSMMLFRSDVWFIPAFELGVYCLVAAAALTLWSMVVYLRAAWPELMRSGHS